MLAFSVLMVFVEVIQRLIPHAADGEKKWSGIVPTRTGHAEMRPCTDFYSKSRVRGGSAKYVDAYAAPPEYVVSPQYTPREQAFPADVVIRPSAPSWDSHAYDERF